METRKQASQARRSRDVASSTARRPAKAGPAGALDVVATAKGFYGGNRIKPGQAFTLEKPEDFSHRWMRRSSDASSVSGQAEATESTTGATGAADPLNS